VQVCSCEGKYNLDSAPVQRRVPTVRGGRTALQHVKTHSTPYTLSSSFFPPSFFPPSFFSSFYIFKNIEKKCCSAVAPPNHLTEKGFWYSTLEFQRAVDVL
jgi:hypothetical protein